MPQPSAYALHAHFGEALQSISDGMSTTEASTTYQIPYKTLHNWTKKNNGKILMLVTSNYPFVKKLAELA